MKRLKDALKSQDFCLTAELNLRVLKRPSEFLSDAKKLAPLVDGVHVSDVDNCPALAVARLLIDANIDPVLQVSAGYRSIEAIETELLGAFACGVTSVQLVRGERRASDSGTEVSAKQMLQLVRELREAQPQLDFSVGTPARVFSPRAGWQPRSLIEKASIGANFIRTQLCFDPAQVKAYVQHLVAAQVTWDASLILSVAVLPSAKGANWLKANMKGAKVPEALVRRLEQARDPQLEGVHIAAELIREFRQIPGVGGISLMSPSGPEIIVEAIKLAAELVPKIDAQSSRLIH